MTDTDTDGRADELAALIDYHLPPAREGRPLPANIIRRPVQLPPMERVKS